MNSTENLALYLALFILTRGMIFALLGFGFGFLIYWLLTAPRKAQGELVREPVTDVAWCAVAPLPELPKLFSRAYIAPSRKARMASYDRPALPRL